MWLSGGDLDNLLHAAGCHRQANIIPSILRVSPRRASRFAWTPAVSLFFQDPGGNSLKFLSMLPDVRNAISESSAESLEVG